MCNEVKRKNIPTYYGNDAMHVAYFQFFGFFHFFFNLLYNKQWQGSHPIVPYYFGKVWDHGGLGEPQSGVSYAWVQKAKMTRTHTSSITTTRISRIHTYLTNNNSSL